MDTSDAVDEQLEKVVARLVAHLAPNTVVLFGSRVSGKAKQRSDIDLLVIGPFVGGSQRHLRRARRLVSGLVPNVDVVLANSAEVESSPFLRSVVESGRVLWRRN